MRWIMLIIVILTLLIFQTDSNMVEGKINTANSISSKPVYAFRGSINGDSGKITITCLCPYRDKMRCIRNIHCPFDDVSDVMPVNKDFTDLIKEGVSRNTIWHNLIFESDIDKIDSKTCFRLRERVYRVYKPSEFDKDIICKER